MMTWSLGRLAILLLAVTVALSGCIGGLSTDLGESLTTLTADDRSASQPSPGTSVALSISMALEETSHVPVTVGSVDVVGQLPASLDLVPRRATIDPGESEVIAALKAPAGSVVQKVVLEVTLYDGLGPATLELSIGPWEVQDDVAEEVVLAAPEAGQVLVVDPGAREPVHPKRDRADPAYGFLEWPNGQRKVLPGFEHLIRVPADHPSFDAGDQVAYQVMDADTASWRLDDGAEIDGTAYKVTLGPGTHVLHLTIPGSGTLEIPLAADHHLEYRDQIPVAMGQVTGMPIEGVNGNSHPLPIQEGADRIRIYLRPAGNATVDGDLDIYLADEEGNWITRSSQPGTSYEVILLPSGLDPGDYRIWVTSKEGAGLEYVTWSFVSYAP